MDRASRHRSRSGLGPAPARGGRRTSLESLLEAPFAERSNRSLRALLETGLALLGAVAAPGHSPLTLAVVGCYLLAVPLSVGVRVRAETGSASEAESPGDRPDEDDSGQSTDD
ncbi:hypothetical protein [Natronococcus sp.]|uniref:hypothetical protein n=1 Tax=Natronococcus sp. TaxID=35747 RepID=UPI003A4DEB1B